MFIFIFTMLRPFPCSPAGFPSCDFLENCVESDKLGWLVEPWAQLLMKLWKSVETAENCYNFISSCFLSPNSGLLASVGKAETAEKEDPRVRKDGKTQLWVFYWFPLSCSPDLHVLKSPIFIALPKSLFLRFFFLFLDLSSPSYPDILTLVLISPGVCQ